MKNALFSSQIEIKVPFHDVDMMEIAWHGHYLKYFEIARCELLDQINYNYRQMSESGYAWPVIDVAIRYVKPAQFEQLIVVTAGLVEYENRLKIDYQICDAETKKRLTKGSTVQVAVDLKSKEMLFVSPPILLKKLGIN